MENKLKEYGKSLREIHNAVGGENITPGQKIVIAFLAIVVSIFFTWLKHLIF